MPKPAKTVELLSPEPALKRRPPAILEPGLGSNAYGDKALEPIFSQGLVKKGEISRNTWADTAYVLVLRAKRAAQTYGKKDFNALYRLVLSAGIAFDKAWPKVETPSTGNILIQVFGGMAPDQLRQVVEPPHPIIDTEISNTTKLPS